MDTPEQDKPGPGPDVTRNALVWHAERRADEARVMGAMNDLLPVDIPARDANILWDSLFYSGHVVAARNNLSRSQVVRIVAKYRDTYDKLWTYKTSVLTSMVDSGLYGGLQSLTRALSEVEVPKGKMMIRDMSYLAMTMRHLAALKGMVQEQDQGRPETAGTARSRAETSKALAALQAMTLAVDVTAE